ncbi:hypothetical protein Mapa_014939 [Marchantia paleacea]|nr:hypothetical protein Mapa_014939 [Marchantia paleacea]
MRLDTVWNVVVEARRRRNYALGKVRRELGAVSSDELFRNESVIQRRSVSQLWRGPMFATFPIQQRQVSSCGTS